MTSLRGWAGRTEKLQESRPETPPDLDRSTPRKNPMEKDVPFFPAGLEAEKEDKDGTRKRLGSKDKTGKSFLKPLFATFGPPRRE